MVQRRSFTQSVPLPNNTEYNVEIKANTDYTAGRLNVSQGVLNQDTIIRATPAVPNKCTITSETYDHQEIILKIYNKAGTQVVETIINPTTLNIAYGTKYSISVQAYEGYSKSSLINIIEDYIYSLTRNIHISTESDGIPIQCEIVVSPQQHQQITVMTDNDLIIDSNLDDEVRVVTPYWTKYIPTIKSDPGYLPGILNGTGEQIVYKLNPNFTRYYPDTQDLSGYVTVTATSARELKRNVTIYKYEHQKIKVTATFEDETTEYTYDSPNPSEVSPDGKYKTFKVFDSSVFTVELIPDTGYQSLYPVIHYSSTQHTDVIDPNEEFTLDKDITIKSYSSSSETPDGDDASITYHSITLVQSKGQTMELSSGLYEGITGTVYLVHNSQFTITIKTINSLYAPGTVIASHDTLVHTVEHNINTYKGTVTDDNVIYATPATLV